MVHQDRDNALRSDAVDLSRCPIAQRLVRPFMVGEAEVVVQAAYRIGHRLIVLEIDLLPFDRAPQQFDEDIVQCAPAPIPTDSDARLLQAAGVGSTGELHALVGSVLKIAG
jgi:hypothetical protein